MASSFMKMRILFLSILCVLGAASQVAGCSEVKIGNWKGDARAVFGDSKVSALAEAGCSGDTKKMERLAKQGVDVNATSKDGGSVLLWVMYCRNHDGFEKLLDLGANPNYKYNGEDSVTFIAAGADSPEWLSMVLAHGGDPSIWGSGPRSALMVAEQYRRRDNIKLLLDHGADVNAHRYGLGTIADYLVMDGEFGSLINVIKHGYNHNLTILAREITMKKTDEGSIESVQKKQILEMLDKLGVKFPLPPLPMKH